MRVLLVSTYELGHQPLHVAAPAGALRRAGHQVRALDLSIDPWNRDLLEWADALALSVPMHTAMRLALGVAETARRARPALPVCLYGLYAGVGPGAAVADRRLAGEYEASLVQWVDELSGATPCDHDRTSGAVRVDLGRSPAGLPARDLLPPLDRYARLAVAGEERLVGCLEASHGCAHKCRHCPLPVVYDGRIRVVDAEAVLADVDQLVQAGARHLTFADPDFLNGPHHARRVVAAVHGAFPDLTFDCTTKVEHILGQAGLWPELAEAGCLFVVSAFESVDDATLIRLDKGHTAADEAGAVALLRSHGIEVRPSWLPFNPWTRPGDVIDILDFVTAHDLIANVDPVQYSIRLLIPDGSLVLSLPDAAGWLGPYDPAHLSWTWAATEPAVDDVQRALARVAERAAADGTAIEETFAEIEDLIRRRFGAGHSPWAGAGPGSASCGPQPGHDRPRLTEPWFCCSEPTDMQLAALHG